VREKKKRCKIPNRMRKSGEFEEGICRKIPKADEDTKQKKYHEQVLETVIVFLL
jgi:hypothetical protein